VETVFGPVPSRRLGRSLGVNNIPPKHCTYSCVYCQVGRTTQLMHNRQAYYGVADLYDTVASKIERLRKIQQLPDYITIIPDGEPTLDIHLGELIEKIRALGVNIAVVTNSSLLWRGEVQEDLLDADLVSVKVDAMGEPIWRKINRPHRQLDFDVIMDGVLSFSNGYKGTLLTETMLIAEVNVEPAHLQLLAEFVGQVHPEIAYLSIPTRPPAEDWVHPPTPEVINDAYQEFTKWIDRVEILSGMESDTFQGDGDLKRALLAITAVHPMRESAVRNLVKTENGQWDDVEELLAEKKLQKISYRGSNFYLRDFTRRKAN